MFHCGIEHMQYIYDVELRRMLYFYYINLWGGKHGQQYGFGCRASPPIWLPNLPSGCSQFEKPVFGLCAQASYQHYQDEGAIVKT